MPPKTDKNGLSNEERQVEFVDLGDYTSQLHAGLLKKQCLNIPIDQVAWNATFISPSNKARSNN